MIYLTPAAVGYLTQLILAAAITLYLTSRLRHTTRQIPTILLAGFFAVTTLFILLLFFDAALAPTPRLYAVYFQNTTTGLILIFLLQFAYRFPRLDPRKKWEARVWLGLAVLYTLWEALFGLYRFTRLGSGFVEYRPPYADYALAVGFLWVPIVFLRQAVFASADDRGATWLGKLWRPQGREAQAARAFALVYLFPLALSLVNIFRGFYLVSTTVYQLSLSAGLLFTLFAFVIVYFNALPETTSYVVKLAGVMLTTLLMGLGAVGWVIAPEHAAGYRSLLPDHQTLRFTPTVNGGYDVARVPFHFDGDLGVNANMPASDAMNAVAFDFTFPFFGQTHSKVYATDFGTISIGQLMRERDVQNHYGAAPTIFPLGIDLVSAAGEGVFAKNEGDRMTITWSKAPAFYRPEAVFTFQVVLQRDGVFEITYNGLPDNLAYEPDANPAANVWIVGAIPGDPAHPPQQLMLTDLPLRGGPQGFVQDYYLEFRGDLHRLLAPLAILILVSSLFVVVGFPMLLYVSLVQPLNALLAGVRQVNAGNRAVTMPIRYHDEIGFLTESFNGMVAKLRDLIATLETRVAERTTDLQASNARLRDEIVERTQAQAQVMEQQRALAALEERERMGRELHDGLGQVMGYINVQAQATRTLVAKGETLAAQTALQEITQVAQDTHADIRNYILGLRIPSVATGTLFQILESYLRQFGETCNLQATLSYPADAPAPAFAPAVEEQVLRIVMEALTNIRKHAAAHKVDVLFSFGDNQAQIIISDDGIGFDPHPSPSPVERGRVGEGGHFGLNIMRERAEQVGGQLEIRSAPGQGTRILAFIPRLLPGAVTNTEEDVAAVAGMRVLLVDDHPLFLDGLRNLLRARGITVIGVARDGVEAQEQARALRPDVIVMDLQMPRRNGLEATRAIKAERPEVKIVMLTVSEEEENLFEAIRSGASGYLLKSLDANQFCRLLVGLMRGEAPLTPALANRVLSEFARQSAAPDKEPTVPLELNPRQWEVLKMVAEGKTYKEVGAAFHLTEDTVKYHMGQILDRLHLESRAQAIAFARRIQSNHPLHPD